MCIRDRSGCIVGVGEADKEFGDVVEAFEVGGDGLVGGESSLRDGRMKVTLAFYWSCGFGMPF